MMWLYKFVRRTVVWVPGVRTGREVTDMKLSSPVARQGHAASQTSLASHKRAILYEPPERRYGPGLRETRREQRATDRVVKTRKDGLETGLLKDSGETCQKSYYTRTASECNGFRWLRCPKGVGKSSEPLSTKRVLRQSELSQFALATDRQLTKQGSKT